MGESSTGVMDVGLRNTAAEEEEVPTGDVRASDPEGSSPALILSSSDLFTYFLP